MGYFKIGLLKTPFCAVDHVLRVRREGQAIVSTVV